MQMEPTLFVRKWPTWHNPSDPLPSVVWADSMGSTLVSQLQTLQLDSQLEPCMLVGGVGSSLLVTLNLGSPVDTLVSSHHQRHKGQADWRPLHQWLQWTGNHPALLPTDMWVRLHPLPLSRTKWIKWLDGWESIRHILTLKGLVVNSWAWNPTQCHLSFALSPSLALTHAFTYAGDGTAK